MLAPVVLVIALGWSLVRLGFLSSTAMGEINRLTYWVGLPALLVVRISDATPSFERLGGLLVVLFGATAAVIALASVVAWWGRLPDRSAVTFVHGAFRGNLVFVGLPVVVYAFANTPQAAAIEASVLVAIVPVVIAYNTLAVTLMQVPGRGDPLAALQRVGRGLVSNPILLATLLGLALALAGVRMPTAVDRTLAALGQMALPLALIGIGGGLYASRMGRGQYPWAWVAALMKTALGPAVGWLIGQWVGLGDAEMRVALTLLACPSAAASYVLVAQMDGDVPLIASIILLSHFMALPAMIGVLALTA
ncbi:AEC family transporter [Spiribacter sp. 390]|uniref:AEC family transporter n=1 Tax=Spiribacter pallidus TaxID=1987936 RepID=A0ABV3TC67_9GAMM